MSIISRMKYVELQSKKDIQAPSGQLKKEWDTTDNIQMSILNKENSIYRSNTLEIAEATHIGITFKKGILKGKNRIKVDDSIYEIKSVNDDYQKSILTLKELEPSG